MAEQGVLLAMMSFLGALALSGLVLLGIWVLPDYTRHYHCVTDMYQFGTAAFEQVATSGWFGSSKTDDQLNAECQNKYGTEYSLYKGFVSHVH